MSCRDYSQLTEAFRFNVGFDGRLHCPKESLSSLARAGPI